MMVFCISPKYPPRMALYASDTLEFYRRTVLDGLNMGCLVPTIPTGRSRLKGCLLVVKNTDFGQTIIRMGKWLQEGTTRTAKKWAIGSFGVAMARRKKARTSPHRKQGAGAISSTGSRSTEHRRCIALSNLNPVNAICLGKDWGH